MTGVWTVVDVEDEERERGANGVGVWPARKACFPVARVPSMSSEMSSYSGNAFLRHGFAFGFF
jgi:hypothetical protein